MSSRLFKLVALSVPLLLGTVACGSSSGGSSTPPSVASKKDPASTAAPSGAAKGANADVEAYCGAVDKFVAANKKMLADPSSVDVNSITQQGLDLAKAAAALATSATGADAARLQECSAKFADIGK
ncbi:MAG: hypothetical protein ABIQ39_16840 [Ilumatobacteraceae bacterium]